MSPASKRALDDEHASADADAASSSDSDVVGPLPGGGATTSGPSSSSRRLKRGPKRARRRDSNTNPALFLAKLPAFEAYAQSFMHRDTVTAVAAGAEHGFVVTGSQDGRIKFWKKRAAAPRGAIEFVKEFAVAPGACAAVKACVFSADGRRLAVTVRENGTAAGSAVEAALRTVKVFDVAGFDMIGIIELEYRPGVACFLKDGLLAVTQAEKIHVYDPDGELQASVPALHKTRVTAMVYNPVYDCAVSVDETGMVEYWQFHGNNKTGPPPSPPFFRLKSSTNLYDFRKSKTKKPVGLTVSPDGSMLAAICFPDRKITVLNFTGGKLLKEYDENLDTLSDIHRLAMGGGNQEEHSPMDDIEFGRRLVVDRELEEHPELLPSLNVIFDESSRFLIYSSLMGIKIVHIATNKCVRTLGTADGLRFMNLALYQGTGGGDKQLTVEMAASDNQLIEQSLKSDPVLFATAYGKPRFYMFTDKDADEVAQFNKADRDVYNEQPVDTRPVGADAVKAKAKAKPEPASTRSVTLHTTLGDITLSLYPQHAPLTVENFVTLCQRGYYDDTIFHRVIKKFMIQGGDPEGDGTGGESMWGGTFQDEFSPFLRHDKAGTLSMANAGPGTNGSQFFITCAPTPWLNDKHTVFGRVLSGMEVVKDIENLKTMNKGDRPLEPPKILSTTIGM